MVNVTEKIFFKSFSDPNGITPKINTPIPRRIKFKDTYSFAYFCINICLDSIIKISPHTMVTIKANRMATLEVDMFAPLIGFL